MKQPNTYHYFNNQTTDYLQEQLKINIMDIYRKKIKNILIERVL